MSEDNRFAPNPASHWSKGQTPEQGQTAPASLRPRPEDSTLNRFLGGSPGSVFMRLLFVSLIVGAFLMWLDIRPWDVFRGLQQLIDRLWGLGFDAIREIINYALAGAVLVVPVWLVLRLMNIRSGR